jgi:hypothetical protein
MYGVVEYVELWVDRGVSVEDKLKVESWRFKNGSLGACDVVFLSRAADK